MHKRRETVSDASERHKGPGQDRIHPTSPNMNSFPVLHFLLLLLGLQAPQVQGRSLLTYPPQQNFKMISEIIDILNSSPSPAEVSGIRLAEGREGLEVSQAKRTHSSLSLPPQETLDPNETNTLLVSTQPTLGQHLGPDPFSAWVAMGLSPHLA